MAPTADDEIDKAISRAVQTGEILHVKPLAMAIAAASGGQARTIAESLITAGIRAGIPMEITLPE